MKLTNGQLNFLKVLDSNSKRFKQPWMPKPGVLRKYTINELLDMKLIDQTNIGGRRYYRVTDLGQIALAS
jgi:hypothetical protein